MTILSANAFATPEAIVPTPVFDTSLTAISASLFAFFNHVSIELNLQLNKYRDVVAEKSIQYLVSILLFLLSMDTL